MPSQALTTFYPGDQTTAIMLDHEHRYLTAFDRPVAANVAHVMVFDSGRRLLSNLQFNCRICNLAADAGSANTNAIDLLDFGPPPAYEVDRELPDYHQQDQERTQRDRPRNRRRSLQQAQVAVRLPVEPPRRSASGSPARARVRGREALERALRVQAEVRTRDFQPLIPEAAPAVPVIARDFQPRDPVVQPVPVVRLPPSSLARTPRVQEDQLQITRRDFQPFTPEARPATQMMARDFQPNAPTVQPVPVVRLPQSSPVRTFGVEEEQSAIAGRDSQPLRPRVQPAALVIARDFQPDDPAVQPVPVVNLPPSSPARTPRVQEDQSEITRRDFQPLTPEAPSATQVIARDFQTDDTTVQPIGELTAGSLPSSTTVRTPRFSEVFDERHYGALARFTEEERENSSRHA